MIRLNKISLLILLLFSQILSAQDAKDSYLPSSVLSTGKWFRIAITEDGVYRMDYSKLKQVGLENPSNPRVFGNNSGQLSYYNNDPCPYDLKELSILTVTGSDGVFNEGDYLLFYGKGTSRWIYNEASGDYDFLRHNYSDTAFYFITSGSAQGKRITIAEEPAAVPDFTSSVSDALFIHEMEIENLIKSGREWYQPVTAINGTMINPGFKDIIASEKIKFRIRILARSSTPTLFRLYEGETIQEDILVPEVDLTEYTGTYARIAEASGSLLPASSSPVYEIKFYNNGEAGAKGWIDYVKLQGRKLNSFTGSAMQYSDSKSVAPGRTTEFTIKCLIDGAIVWDITDPYNLKGIQYTKTGENIKFKATTDTLKTFLVFTPDKAIIPSIKQQPVPNQDLHSSDPADMIIVTHPLFKNYAKRLAGIHLNNSGLISLVVTPEQIYNEFSGGIPDIVAIRNFVRMKYQKQKGSKHPLKYLLLFGDGSYENKTLPPNNPNFIPTYQSQNSNVVVSSFTSDDFFGLLDDGEGEAEGTEDIGIGRLPVSDTVQAGIMVFKIANYINPANNGDWKNVICITADDEDGNTHMYDAEGLASIIEDSVPSFNIHKIYLDAYKQITSANGQSYPEVTKVINNRINSGCLIFNYIGHGNENGLAHERVLKTDDINSWKNNAKLPLFITATCEFSRFDDIDINIITGEMTGKPSAGEKVLLNKNGGGIALMTTTRLVYSAPNYFLNRNIYDAAFDRDSSGNALRLGDIIRIAKNNSGSGANKRNFLLLGDPAVRLAYPWHGQVITDSINHINVNGNIDSLKALSLVTITGHIEDIKGQRLNTFNGVVSPTVYDKAGSVKTLANDGGQIMEFDLRNSIIFSGKTMASDGKFKFTFIVPRDIDYTFGKGKISYYASDFEKDMNGSFSNMIVGGFSNSALADTTGPVIKLYMNDTLFRNGGITDVNPRLLAIIEDKGGINTSGSGIGHDLTAFLDNDPANSIVLNNYFENDFDNYMKGKLSYDLIGLSKGSHSIKLKAWDNFNNSSEESILFLVETGEGFILKNLLNYPNPFLNETRISAEHNRPDTEFDIIIRIFNMSGKIVKIIKTSFTSTGYKLPPVLWDGNDDGGKRVGKGIYPYSVMISTIDGETAWISGRMIIL